MKTLALCVAAAAVALLPIPAALVEHAYSGGLYSFVQRPLTSASNSVPFAVFDAAIVSALFSWIALAARDVRARGWTRGAATIMRRSAAWVAAGYLLFLAAWGLNYRREPMAQRLQFDRGAVTPAAAIRVAGVAVDRLNALAEPAHAVGWRASGEIDPALAEGFRAASFELGFAPPIVARPKPTLLDPFFRRAGVAGMTDPFFLETLVVGDLLPFERPHVVAHEWGHLAGLANEAEASFAGWLACLRGSLADQYSGWLFLYGELAAALPRQDRAAVAGTLGARPRADLDAVRARLLRDVQPAVSDAAWRAYDSYLKSNRVASGTRSYGDVVQLVLGVTFDEQWRPRRR